MISSLLITVSVKPFYKILLNAGYGEESIHEIEEVIKGSGNFWEGYNPRSEEYVNMFVHGIIDPTKVTRLALENAASVAGTMLITEAVVSINNEDDKKEEIDPSMMM
jgi:chaperonin GroEL